MLGLVQGLLFGVGFGDQTFLVVPLGFQGFGAPNTSLGITLCEKTICKGTMCNCVVVVVYN